MNTVVLADAPKKAVPPGGPVGVQFAGMSYSLWNGPTGRPPPQVASAACAGPAQTKPAIANAAGRSAWQQPTVRIAIDSPIDIPRQAGPALSSIGNPRLIAGRRGRQKRATRGDFGGCCIHDTRGPWSRANRRRPISDPASRTTR